MEMDFGRSSTVSTAMNKKFVHLLTSVQQRYKFPSNVTPHTKIQESKILKKRELEHFLQKTSSEMQVSFLILGIPVCAEAILQ